MKILFDQGTPAPLRRALAAHAISTTYEMGWSDLDNGAPLNLRYQQDLKGRRLAIVILPTTSWPKIRNALSQIISAVDQLQHGDVCELTFQ